MKTTLSGATKTVTIDTEGPMVMIGEKINPTGRKRLAAALTEGDMDYVLDLARRQVEAGADVLDVNVGVPGIDEVAKMKEVVAAVTDTFDIPLCIDSPNHAAVAAGVEAASGRCLVNSVNGEEVSMNAILSVVKEHDTAVILITHDMGVIAEISDRVAVMYAGRLVEVGKVRDVVKNSKHPYSQGLMGSIPSLHHKSDKLVQIEGTMPRLTEIPDGCSFHPRCPHCFDRCRSQRPDLLNTEPTKAACWLYDGEN